jgi:ATP-binding cassette subfamily C (CFTR/MRP) protein 1
MNNVERVRYFTDQVSQEAPYCIDDDKGPSPAGPWPTNGAVSFQDCGARYRPELPLVLQGLTMEIRGSQKIGVCGRTGSGKSTLMLLLFRVLELQHGRIEIDGLDISTLGLSTLRRAIAMLPQDPTLFSGSIRFNLDPFGTCFQTPPAMPAYGIWRAPVLLRALSDLLP